MLLTEKFDSLADAENPLDSPRPEKEHLLAMKK